MNGNKKLTKQFSLDDLKLIRKEESDSLDFFIGRLGFIASGENRQDCWISEETLREYAPTIKGKFITAKYNWWTDDVMSHENDLDIIGYVPPESEITFEKTPDGRLMAYCDAVLSKIYCYDVYKLFQKDNYRSVSAEFSCNMADEDSDTGEIIAIDFHSITILGKEVSPAIPNANIRIVKFSKDQANEFYSDEVSKTSLRKFAEDRKKKLNNNKESNKSDEEENMKKDKEFKDNEEDIIMDETGCYSDKEKDKEFEDDKEKESKEKEFEDTQEIADKDQDEKDDEEEKEIEEKEFSKDEKEKDEKKEKEEKKFSLESYVDATATLAMLEKETEQRKELAHKVLKEMGAEKLFSTIMELSKENEELKKEKEDREDKDKEKKFSSIMAEVKGDIPEDDYKKLYEKGKTLKFAELENFNKEVKAFAWESSKNTNSSLFRVGVENQKHNTSPQTIEDIYSKYL